MRSIIVIAAIIGVTSLAGCKEEEKVSLPAPEIETTHDVAYYEKNKSERDALLAKCKADPAKYALNGNCINAERAKNKSSFSSNKGTGKVKAITADEMFGSR